MSPTIRNQAKLAAIALAAGLAFTAFGAGTALAVSPKVQECEEAGGTYTKDGPIATCDFGEEKVGQQPDHSQGQTTHKKETGQGNLDNKEDDTCEGPPGQCAKR